MKRLLLVALILTTISSLASAQPPAVPGYGLPVVSLKTRPPAVPGYEPPVVQDKKPAAVAGNMAALRELVQWDRLPENRRKDLLDALTEADRAAFLKLDGVSLPPKKNAEVVPPPAKAAKQANPFSFAAMHPVAMKERKPLIVFVGVPRRDVEGCVTAYEDVWNSDEYGSYTKMILVSPDRARLTWMYANVSDSDIRQELGLEVSPQASPFLPGPSGSRFSGQPFGPAGAEAANSNAKGSPWLPEDEQGRLRKMLREKGVPASDNLKFYRLPSVYQNMYTMNNGRSRINEITEITDVDPWRVSGGMHHISDKEWRNVTGLDLPGKIEYWQEDTDVRAFALVPKWRWRFPKGTLAYDVLLRVKDGKEHIFEVRTQEKLDGGWDEGTIYRPKVQVPENAPKHRWTWEFAREGLQGSATTYTSWIDPSAQFAPTRSLVVDGGDFTPPKYAGAGMSCNACHRHVGELYDVPGRIYRESRRGDDGRFSWHPFRNGAIDPRWPLARK